MVKGINIEEIYYGKEYQVASKIPTERFLFIQWILDFVCVTEALSSNYDRWYQQLFYIKLAELLKMKSEEISPKFGKDKYILKVTTCLHKICDALSDDECIYIVYRRDSAAHPFQNGYDIFDTSGEKIKKERVLTFKEKSISLGREDINRAIDKVLESSGNIDKNCDLEIVKKLSPSILELKEGLYENYMNSITFFE